MNKQLIERLEGFKRRVTTLNGLSASPGNLDGLDKIFETALKAGTDDEKKMRDLLDGSRNKVQDAILQLNEMRMENIDLFVRATSNWMMLYNVVTLADNQQPLIEHSYRNPVRVRYTGEDGGSRTVKAVKARKKVTVDMRLLEAGPVGYQIRDLNLGTDIAAAALATVDLGWEMTNKLDVEHQNFLFGGTINGVAYGAGVYGAFVKTGAALARTWIEHPRIQSANLPSTNDYANSDLDDYVITTGPQNFRLSVIRKIMGHCASFGNIFGSPLRPTGAIMVPSSELLGLAKEFSPTGDFSNEVGNAIVSSDFITFDFMGVRWTLIPDVTLPSGRCYPVLNRPVANFYVKPSMDQEFVETNLRKNWEERAANKVIAHALFEPWRAYALRLAYKDSPSALTTNE